MTHAIEVSLKEDIQNLFNSFTTMSGVRIAFYSAEFKELRVGLKSKGSGFCRFLKKVPWFQCACDNSDLRGRTQAQASCRATVYTCHAGLKEAIIPIIIEQELIGYVMIGQIRTGLTLPGKTAAKLRKKHNKKFINTASKLYRNLPYYSGSKLSSLIKIFAVIVDFILSKNLIALKKNIIIDRITSYASAQLNEMITLNDAAELTGKSTSLISKLFQKQYSKSFKKYMLELKLQAAEKMFKTDPFLSIANAADALGFYDQFHFSRIYKKFRGVSPMQFKKRNTN